MRHLFRWSTGFFAFLLLTAFSPVVHAASGDTQAHSATADSSTGSPTISIPESTYNFGEIPEGGEVSHNFTIRNTGDAPLDINEVRPG